MASIALSNITPKITKEKYPIASPSFLKPGTRDWEPLQAASCCNSEDDKEQMEKAQETLKNFLLQSLQMQHLVVLAGSGCSIYAGAPSMSNLWDAVIGEPPSE